jgi:hypothetical protein
VPPQYYGLKLPVNITVVEMIITPRILTHFWKRLLSIPCAQENAHTIAVYQSFGTTNKNQIQVRTATNHSTAAPLPIGTPLFYDQNGALKGKKPTNHGTFIKSEDGLATDGKNIVFRISNIQWENSGIDLATRR